MKKQADGRYKTKVVVGTRSDGTKVVKWVTAKTRREIEEKRQAAIIKYRDGAVGHLGTIMAMEWIYRWYDTVAAPGMSEAVASQKRRRIETYIEPYLKDKQLRAVTVFDLQEILNACDKGHTVMVQLSSVLKNAFRTAYAEGIIARDVSASLISRVKPYQSSRAFTDEESSILEQSLANRTTEPLMLSLFYYTGMRRGEVLGLEWRDIDFEKGIIHVRRSLDLRTGELGKLKTPASERDIPIGAELMEILKEHRGIGNALVIHSKRGEPIAESTFKWRWKRVEALLGTKEITPHYFRHNYATRLYDAGADVLTAAKVLGHSDPTTTLKIYTDIKNSRRVEAGKAVVKTAFTQKK
jgi:integrase